MTGNFVSTYVDENNGNNIGNGTFTVSYSFPPSASAGSNLTGQVTLQVSQLNGFQVYVQQYQITAQLVLPSSQGASGMVSGSSPLYPGAIWGPKNLTVPIAEETKSLSVPVNASLTLILATTVLVQVQGQGPSSGIRIHQDSMFVGNATIGGSPNGGRPSGPESNPGIALLPYLVVVAGALLVCIGVFLPRIAPSKALQRYAPSFE
ncbi:MAG TPA: hypothetical protein VLX56_00570 [Nitrososphaerales archaeon]|nr:hypothetical protein [Nitrososphaerales archaeon]